MKGDSAWIVLQELWDELAEICNSLEESQKLKVPTKDWDFFVVVGHAG